MDNKTYKKIQKLIILAGIVLCIIINIKQILSYGTKLLSIFTPFITGICIAFVLGIPMQKIESFLEKHIKKKSRGISILITILAFILMMILISYMIVPEVLNSISEVKNAIPDMLDNLERISQDKNNVIIRNLSSFGIDINKIVYDTVNFFKNISITDASSTLQKLFSATSDIFSSIMNLLLGVIFAIYILAQKEELIKQAKSLIQSVFDEEKSKKIIDFFVLVDSSFAKFVAGQGVEAVILGLLFLVSMSVLTIPKALPVSAVIGLFSLVPIVGAMIASAFGVLVIMIASPIKSLWFLILYLVLQQIEGNLIYPRVVGKSVGLPGIWVLLAITVGGKAGGLVGMILAVPVMSIVYTLLSQFVESKKK